MQNSTYYALIHMREYTVGCNHMCECISTSGFLQEHALLSRSQALCFQSLFLLLLHLHLVSELQQHRTCTTTVACGWGVWHKW
jgi:hypothetical protein